uniref:Uncharacterized protein n=1 Tax=Glossina pallidipes TaxID=7398 RepID=A0A1A9ZIR7_GLOPL
MTSYRRITSLGTQSHFLIKQTNREKTPLVGNISRRLVKSGKADLISDREVCQQVRFVFVGQKPISFTGDICKDFNHCSDMADAFCFVGILPQLLLFNYYIRRIKKVALTKSMGFSLYKKRGSNTLFCLSLVFVMTEVYNNSKTALHTDFITD